MKKLVMLSTIFVTLTFGSSLYKKFMRELYHLSEHQKIILLKTYIKAKQFGYENTMTAIAWQESQFGKYLVDLSGPSFGVFHNLVSSVARRNGKSGTSWSNSRIAERLILDYDFSFSQALAELKYWENYWRSKGKPHIWRETVGSYNGGYRWRHKKSAVRYLKYIIIRVRVLKVYMRENYFNLTK